MIIAKSLYHLILYSIIFIVILTSSFTFIIIENAFDEFQEKIEIIKTDFESKQKDLIKVENTVFDENQANQLALFAPNATINVIEDFEVVRKFHVSTPEQVKAVFACPNSNCISHNEPIDSNFYVRHQQQDIKLKCHYCEKTFDRSLFSELD